jgi:2-desacetyl-2-hydroxyethyl bacteriochlorophyllide A dehydrogenase
MQALWLDGLRVQLRWDVPRPQAGAGEALVRVRLVGICATDLELIRGYYPFIGVPGHEFVGEITEATDAPARVGERVVGEINLPCGACRQCRAGRPVHCEERRVLGIKNHHGAFAQYLTLPLTNLHRVPDRMPDAAAVFAEPLAAALEIMQQVRIAPAHRVLLVGAGRLGQLIARVLKLSGCQLQAVARHPRQRQLLERAGIPWLDEKEVPERAFDRVVEATGAPAGFVLARRALRPRGTLVLKSTYRGRMEVDLSSLVVDEITLLGSRCGPFAPALRLLEQGLVDPLPLIDGRFALEEGEAALARAAEPGAMKVLLDCA